jgi:SET domain-containing protein
MKSPNSPDPSECCTHLPNTLSTGETSPPPPWEIKTSAIHGTGLFARYNLPKGWRLIEYVGRRISKSESLALCQTENPYIFYINKKWDLDGMVDWNPARFINHSCDPNCEAIQEDDRIFIASIRPICAGEELTYNYGYDLDEYRDYPCCCGSARCAGYIVADEYIPIVAKSNLLRSTAGR